MKYPEKVLDIGEENGEAALSNIVKQAFKTIQGVMGFCHDGERKNFGNFLR